MSGLSLPSYLLETLSLQLSIIYHLRIHPLSFLVWGENVFLVFSNIFILKLWSGFDSKTIPNQTFWTSLVLSLSLMSILYSSYMTPLWLLITLQSLNLPLGFLSGFTALFTNYKQKSTGNLSLTMIIISFITMMGRLLTLWIEWESNRDYLSVYGCLSGLFIVTGLLTQISLYWNQSPQSRIIQSNSLKLE